MSPIMPLAPGSRLGPYAVVGSLGAGGMGEVYRAHDAKLHRDVAIKVLPDLFASDPERLARFEREAQALASLNHPNIAQIHGVLDDPPALVMECVEGEDLAHRIARGPIPLDEVIPIARQIADALETAHDRGIIHRDLKPANIKVSPDGTVKVLDFGLAKAVNEGPAGETAAARSLSNSPTLTSPLQVSRVGLILGTAAYMAPEQARGKPVDRRADIWAFGCVLIEMLTGRTPFRGADLTDTLAAIVRDPPDLQGLPAATPPAVRELIERCLQKDPRERLRDIGEARIALTRSTAAAAVRVRARSNWIRPVGWAALGALVAAAIALAVAPRQTQGSRAVGSLRQITQMPGAEINPDISPDGRQVLYAAGAAGSRDLYLLRVGGGRAIDLTPGFNGDDLQGAFSPNGDRIAFRSGRDGGGIFVMGATGESVRRITSAGFDPRWSPDGRRLAYGTEGVDDPYSRASQSELWTVDVESGAADRVYAGDAVQPAWSPHGSRIAFWTNTGGRRDIQTIAAAGGAPVPVTADPETDWAPEWSPDGRSLYFISDRGGSPNLWRVAIDESTGAPAGAPEPVTNGVRALASARFSHDGTRMVLGASDRSFELSQTPFDPAHAERGGPGRTIRSASLGWCSPSRDAAWLACTSRSGQEDVVLLRADGGETRRLTDDPFKDRIPFWSPDGERLAFMSTRSGRWELWTIDVDGSGLRQLTDLRADIAWGAWAPDGTRMAIGSDITPPFGVWIIDTSKMATRETARFVPTDVPLLVDSWSTDGTLLAGTESDASGDPVALTIWDAAGPRIRRRIELRLARVTTIGSGFVPGTHDVLVNTPDGVALVDADSGRSRVIRAIAPPLVSRLSGDGRTLLVERPGREEDVWLMEFGASPGG